MRAFIISAALTFAVGARHPSEFICTGENQTLDYVAEFKDLGCWTDSYTDHTVGAVVLAAGAFNSPQYCSNLCGSSGYRYAGLGYQTYVQSQSYLVYEFGSFDS
jgi:hypothetical protein